MMRWRGSSSFLLLFPLALLFVAAYQTQREIALDLTTSGNEEVLDGFYKPDGGARWTQDQSAVWLPSQGGRNLALRVGLRLSGASLGQAHGPRRVIISLNGEKLADFNAAEQERDYEWSIAPWQLGINGDLLLEIASETFRSPSDSRELGVQVSRVWVTRGQGLAVPPLRPFVRLLGLLGSCALLFQIFSRRWRRWIGEIITGTVRQRFIDQLFNPPALILFGLGLFVVIGLAFDRIQTTWWLGLCASSLFFIAVLTWLIARIIEVGSPGRREAVGVVTIFGLAALIRLAFDAGRGYEGDVDLYLALVWKTVRYGIQSAYIAKEVIASDNPPLLLYPFWFLGWLYKQLVAPLFSPPWINDPRLLRVMLRLPGETADLLAGALIFRVLRRMSVPFAASLIATGAYLFNPVLIFDSGYWGNTAAVHILFMLLALIAIERCSFEWAGAGMAAAILTKPQALAIVPIVCLRAFRERRVLRFSAGVAGTALLLTIPFIVTGHIQDVVNQYLSTTEYHPVLSANAHNFWWLVSGGHGWLSDTAGVGPISFRMVGLFMFALATLLSLAVIWRDRRMLFPAAAYQSLAFFMLNTQIHEDHLLAMFAPLVIAAALDRSLWWLYGAFTLTALANMILHDPNLFVTWLGYPVSEVLGGPAFAVPRWLNAAAQTGLFIVFTVRLMKPFFRASPSIAGAPAA
jgi:hypothetical protein